MEPPPPGGGGDGSNGRQQWSAARLPPVQDGQGPGRVLIADPPTGPDQPGQRNPPQPIPQLQQELPKIQMLLNQAMQTASQLLANYNHDNALLRNMSDSWIDGVQFINPWLQEVYGRYATEVTGLRAQIAPLQAQAGACVLAIKNAKQSASPPIRVLLAKRSIWDNVLDPTGPWTNLKIDCPPPIFPGSRPGEIVGLNVDSFTSDLVAGMRQGKSWDQAIAAALANPRNNPAQVALSPTSVYAVALKVWANCLRRLYEAKFRIALRQYYPELTEAQRETMIPVLFDCDRDFTPAQRAELTALQTLTTGADAKIDGLSAQIATLENQINTDVLRRFHAEARACQEQAAAQVLNAQNIQRILSAAAVEAATPGSPGSTPSYPGVGPDNGRAAFCQALQQILMFPPVQNCPGLTAYLMSLLHGTCGQ